MTINALDPNQPRLAYRLGELAAALGVSRWTLRRIIDRGELATTKVASVTVVTAEEVQRFLTRHQSRRARPENRRGAESHGHEDGST